MTGETLRLWLKQADLDEGERSDGLTSDEQEELRRLRREHRILREEREIRNKAAAQLALGRPTRSGGDEFVEREKATHPVRRLCRVLDISPSGYWAWRRREPSARVRANAQLTEHLVPMHQASRGTYRALQVKAEIGARGMPCGHNRVARLMRQAGLAGCHRRHPAHGRATRRAPAALPAPDLVQRRFAAPVPGRLGTADITYLPTEQDSFLYLAVILDACSRRVVGWSIRDHLLRTELVLAELEMAVWSRRPEAGVIHHSDHGCPASPSLPQCSSASGVRRRGSAPRWEPSAIATTMR